MRYADRFGRTLLAAIVLGSLLLLGACSSDDDNTAPADTTPPAPTRTATLSATGYTPHAGQAMHVALVNTGTSAVVATTTITVPSDGAFVVSFSQAMSDGSTYQVDFYADGDAGAGTTGADGVCGGSDHVWRVAVTDADADGVNDVANMGTPSAVAGDVAIDSVHNTQFTAAACDSFGGSTAYDLTVTGTGYAPHAGQTLRFALVDTATSAAAATGAVVVASDGTFSLTLPAALADGGTYTVDYYADGDAGAGTTGANGTCEAQPTDHQWQVAVTDANADGLNDVANMGTPSAVAGSVTIDTAHNTQFTAVCDAFASPAGPFTLVFAGRGYTPHTDQTMHLALVDPAGPTVVSTSTVVVPTSGDFNVVFPAALGAGTAYNLDYYADGNAGAGTTGANDTCDAAPADHQWRDPVTAASTDMTIARSHDTNFADVCASFP